MKFIFFLSCILLTCSADKPQEKVQLVIIDIPIKSPEQICAEKITEAEEAQPLRLMSEESKRNRLKLLYHAKGSPVYLTVEPKKTELKTLSEIGYNRRIDIRNPWGFIEKNKAFFESHPSLSRKLFLREGYLYNSNPLAAHAISQLVGARVLFNEPRFWVQRGSALMKAERRGKYYYFGDGPYKGRVVTVNFMDRLTLERPGKPLHIDFVPAKNTYHFNWLDIKFVSETHVVASLNYSDIPGRLVRTLFKRREFGVDMVCETEDTSEYRKTLDARAGGIKNLRAAMLEQIAERIPFDEPKYEVGQEDGKLRDAWVGSFYRGRLKYQYKNELMVEENYIYGHLGHARPPQVCVDFLVDTIDRAAGSRYSGVFERKHSERISGSFDSRLFRYENENGKEKHYALRNVDGITHFAKDHPQWFNVIKVPQKKRVRIGSKEFWDYLPTLMLQSGDMVFIRGYVPWDSNQHSHSFYIYNTDPLTGMPILLAGNAGPASLRPWVVETNRTPQRKVKMIIRPTDELLLLLSSGRDVMYDLVIR